MAEPITFNAQAFQPYAGGRGKRFTANTTSGSSAYLIPGLTGGTDERSMRRVIVSNGGGVSAFVRMGQIGVAADTDCTEILPGVAYLLTPPDVNPSGVWIAAVTESGETKISVVAGVGV